VTIPIKNLYYLLCYAWERVDFSDAATVSRMPFRSGQDLLGYVFAHGIASLIRRGLDRGYRFDEEELAGLRGSIAMSETIMRSSVLRGRLVCRFDELTHDVIQNRLLRSALVLLLRMPDLDAAVKDAVATIHRLMKSIDVAPLSRKAVDSVPIHRNNREYRFLLELGLLIHDCLTVSEGGSVVFRGVADERLADLFERFLRGFFRKETPSYRVGHPRIYWADAEGSASDMARLPTMQTDMVLMKPDRRIVVEAKFYQEALQEYKGRTSARSSHLYQIMAYLENIARQSPGRPVWEGLVLYPVVKDSFHFDWSIMGRRVRMDSVDLNRDWQDIKVNLLDLVGSSSAS
jgi:5-methylcytosine-specific restriction enzyme subunit McrC